MKKIVVLGRHQFMMDKVLPLLKNNGYDAIGFLTDDDVINYVMKNDIDAIVFGGGVELESREHIKTTISNEKSSLKYLVANPQTILTDLNKIFEN